MRKKVTSLFAILLILALSTVMLPAQVQAAAKLNVTKKTLVVGEILTLKVTGTEEAISWKTSNKTVAGVTKNGKVVAYTAGSAVITATYGKKSLKCTITVKENPKLSSTAETLTEGETVQLKVTGTAQTVTWSTSKKTVATVTKGGKITAKAAGTAVITATVGTETFKCTVKVLAKAKISSDAETLTEGGSVTLKVTGTNETILWTSSDLKVANVTQNGTVTAKSAGTAVISAKFSDTTMTCKVTVEKSEAADGSRAKPLSAYKTFTSDVYTYDDYLGKFTIQMLDFQYGEKANTLVAKNKVNTKPSASQEYIYAKFKLTFVSGPDGVDGVDVIDYYTDFFNSTADTQITDYDYAVGYEDASSGIRDMAAVSMYPGGDEVICSMAILIKSGSTPITYRLQTGYDSEKLTPIYTWFTTAVGSDS